MTNDSPHLHVEPFRILFPLGYILAILGLGIWILDYLEPSRPYPGKGHAVVMMQGFAFSFSVGIILTEIRKAFGTLKPPLLIHLAVFPVLLLAMAAAALTREIGLSQMFFFLASAVFFIFVALIFFHRKRPAHPDFVFTVGAVFAALAGSFVWQLGEAQYLPVEAVRWGQLSCLQVFFLLFVFDTFHWESEKSRTPQYVGNGRRATINILVVTFLFIAITIEAFAPIWYPEQGNLILRAAYALKAGLVFWFIFVRVKPANNPYTGSARIALFFILLGLALPVLFPEQAIAVSHFTYVAGFCWFVLARATSLIAVRHSFRLPLEGWGTVALYGTLLILGGVLRIFADFFPGSRSILLLLAAIFILSPILLWTFLFARYIGDTEGNYPKRTEI